MVTASTKEPSATADSVIPSDAPDVSENKSAEASEETNKEEEQRVQEVIATDLKNWQEKFAKASDKGADDLEERVEAIAKKQIDSQVNGVGQALLIELEEAIKSSIADSKKKIISTIERLPSTDRDGMEEQAQNAIAAHIRAAGLVIKGKAQALRSWKQNFYQETGSLVTAATESTLAVIDNIRDLGLQEVGMKWAWMEGVSYKDWSRYHALKQTFDDWRKEVEDVAWNHKGIAKLHAASEELESKGMSLAENAAKDLAKLKEAGVWKVQARDTTDVFSVSRLAAAAARANQVVMDRVDEAQDAIKDGIDSVAGHRIREASNQAKNAASSVSAYIAPSEAGVAGKASSKISDAIVGREPSGAESVLSGAKAKVAQASKSLSPDNQHAPESLGSQVKSKAAGVSSEVSQAAAVAEQPTLKSVQSRASESIMAAASAISEALPGNHASDEDPSGAAASVGASASSAASQASKKVWGGAAAQKVKNAQTPILDDIVEDADKPSFSDKMQSMVKDAGENLAEMTEAVREALLKSPSSQGSVESATSLASEQYSRALSAASSALYGTQLSGVESIGSVVSSKYADAVSA